MRLEEAIKEFLVLQAEQVMLPEEIKMQEGVIDKLLLEEQGIGLNVDQVQDIFDITTEIAKMKEEQKLICTRLAELKNTILAYIKAVQNRKIIFTHTVNKNTQPGYVFEMMEGRLALNGTTI